MMRMILFILQFNNTLGKKWPNISILNNNKEKNTMGQNEFYLINDVAFREKLGRIWVKTV